MKNDNYMELNFKSLSINESFARACVAAFCLQLNPTIDELSDIKTAVSEAVTNCVVHAYPDKIGDIKLECEIRDDTVTIVVMDNGIGIKDFEKAKEPFYTTKPNEERSGMGFAVMESFMDELILQKNNPKGVKVIMKKKLNGEHISKFGGLSAIAR